MSELNVPTINIDDVNAFGDFLPAGKYTAKMTEVEGKQSKNNKPMVVATFEVSKGEQEGKEAKVYFSLAVTKGKNGKTYAGGIIDIKKLLASVGKALPQGFAFPLNETKAAQLVGKAVKGHTVELIAYEEADKNGDLDDNGNVKKYTRVKVIGGTPSAQPVSTAPAAEYVDPYGD